MHQERVSSLQPKISRRSFAEACDAYTPPGTFDLSTLGLENPSVPGAPVPLVAQRVNELYEGILEKTKRDKEAEKQRVQQELEKKQADEASAANANPAELLGTYVAKKVEKALADANIGMPSMEDGNEEEPSAFCDAIAEKAAEKTQAFVEPKAKSAATRTRHWQHETGASSSKNERAHVAGVPGPTPKPPRQHHQQRWTAHQDQNAHHDYGRTARWRSGRKRNSGW